MTSSGPEGFKSEDAVGDGAKTLGSPCQTHNQLSHQATMRVLVGVMMAMLLASLDNTILATAMPTIVGQLGSLKALTWVFTAYILASLITVPIYGKLSDLYGRKRLLTIGILIFTVGSVACGLSQSMLQLILFRALQGLGAGGIMTMVGAFLGDLFSPRERGRYMGYLTSVIAASSIAGPLIGGFFVEHLTWRWAFYVNVPVAAAALVLVRRSYTLRVPTRKRKIDYLGALWLTAGVGSLVFITVSSERMGWGSLATVGLGAATVLFLALFVRQERRASDPIVPMELFRERIFRVACGMNAVSGAVLFAATVFIPVFLQLSRGVPATSSGLVLAPLMVAFMVTSTAGGRLMSRWGRHVPLVRLGSGLIVVGIGLLAQLEATSGQLQVSAAMVVVGAGMGLSLPALFLALQNSVDPQHRGVGTSAFPFFNQIGGVVGVSFFGALLNATAMTHIKGALGPQVLRGIDPSSLLKSPAAVAGLAEPARSVARTAVADGIGLIFLVSLFLAAVAFLMSWRLSEKTASEQSTDFEAEAWAAERLGA